VIGQFCNDRDFREKFIVDFAHTTKCVLYIYDHCCAGSSMACKAMFVLKQLMANHNDMKADVGGQIIGKLLAELGSPDKEVDKSSDFLAQAIMLLQMLASAPINCQRLGDASATDVLERISKHPNARRVDGFKRRVEQLQESIEQHTRRDVMR